MASAKVVPVSVQMKSPSIRPYLSSLVVLIRRRLSWSQVFGKGFGGLASGFLLRVSSASLWRVYALYPDSLSQGKVETQVDADNHRVAVNDAQHLVDLVGV